MTLAPLEVLLRQLELRLGDVEIRTGLREGGPLLDLVELGDQGSLRGRVAHLDRQLHHLPARLGLELDAIDGAHEAAGSDRDAELAPLYDHLFVARSGQRFGVAVRLRRAGADRGRDEHEPDGFQRPLHGDSVVPPCAPGGALGLDYPERPAAATRSTRLGPCASLRSQYDRPPRLAERAASGPDPKGARCG
jgi:hypothetical protein